MCIDIQVVDVHTWWWPGRSRCGHVCTQVTVDKALCWRLTCIHALVEGSKAQMLTCMYLTIDALVDRDLDVEMCMDLYTQDVDWGWSWCWHVCTCQYRWCIMWLLIFRLLSIPHRAWLTIDVYTHAKGEGNAGMYVHQAHAHKVVVHIICWLGLKPMQTYMQRWHMFRFLLTPHRAWVDDWHIHTCKGRR